MRIGTMYLGRVEDLLGESVQTKFVVVIVPVIPLASYYVVSDLGATHVGYKIPLHTKSVVLGYTRLLAWIAAVVSGFLFYVDPARTVLLVWTLLFTAIGAMATSWFGGLSPDEAARRTILKRHAGTAAPIAVLPDEVREATARRLLSEWVKHDGRAWDRAIEQDVADERLFVLAEYHRRPDLAARALAAVRVAAPGGDTALPYR